MKRALTCSLLVVIWVVAPFAFVHGEEQAFPKILPSTIWVVIPDGADFKVGTGSVVEREQRLAVTCMHVLHGHKEMTVYFPIQGRNSLVVNALEYIRGKTGIRAKVVATDANRDLALLQLDRLPEGVPSLEIAESAPGASTPVFAIGNSGNGSRQIATLTLWKQYRTKVTKLTYSQQTLENAGMTVHTWAIVLDDRVFPGDSGGPLVDAKGQLVGVLFCQDKEHGYAVDAEEVRLLLEKYRHRHDPAPALALTGNWTAQAQPKDKPPGFFRVSFTDDGRLDWITNKTFNGKFELADDHLKIVIPGLKVNETVTINWQGNDEFSFVSSGVKFIVTRR
jgi:S1-C subfamily serine protease